MSKANLGSLMVWDDFTDKFEMNKKLQKFFMHKYKYESIEHLLKIIFVDIIKGI